MNIKDFFRGYSEADIISATDKLTGDFEPHSYIPVTTREMKAIAGEGISVMTANERYFSFAPIKWMTKEEIRGMYET